MTVSVQTTYTTVAGSGINGPFSIPFKFTANAEVVVEKIDSEGTVTTLTGNTITGAGVAEGGTLYTALDVESGESLRVYRNTPLTQLADYTASDSFPAETHEGALDRLTRICQELARDLGRAFKVAIGGVGPEVGITIAGVVTVDEDGLIVIRDDLVGDTGPRGPPGGGGGAIGLFSDIAGLTIPEGTDMVQVTGRAAVGDAAAGKFLIRVTDDIDLGSEAEDEDGALFRWAPGQILCPEMFEDDAEEDALSAFRQMHDLVNFYGGGHCVGQPESIYLFPNVATTPTTFSSRTFDRADGKTCTHAYIGRGIGEPRDPQLAGVAYYTFDGQGCTIQHDGDFNLASTDYQSGYRKRDTRIVWDMWKCANVVLKNFTWDGGWGDQTTDTGGSGECWSYAIRLTGVAGCEISHVVARNGAQDFVVTAHRNKASLNGIALVSTEAYPEPDASTADVHDPAGICHSLVVRSCAIDHFRRQGFSPVGIGYRDLVQDFPGLTIEDTIVSNIGRFPGAAPRWFTGDVTDGSIKWQWRGFPPRSAVDFEPVRVSGYQVTDSVFRNCNFTDCIGSFAASTGSWKRARVEQSLAFSAVDVSANTFTKTALTLPRTRLNGIPAKIRCWSDNTLPGGLAEKADYYLSKTSDTVFKLHKTPADAIAGTNAVDISSQGAGNHWFIWLDTPPNVGKVTFDGCSLRHPADGSVLPMQVNCEELRVVNCKIHVAAGSAFLGPNAVYEERQVWQGNSISFVRGGFDIDNYSFLKTQSLDGGEMDASTDTLTLAVDDGLGKYEYVPVKLKVSGAGASMPGGLTQGVTYFMVRTGALTRKFCASVDAARGASYINITGAGAGLLSYYRDIAQYDVIGNRFEHEARYLEFDASLVSLITGRIPIPEMYYRREGVNDSEHFELVAVAGGALPTGFSANTTYYAFMDYEDYTGVYLAASSADAIAHNAIKPTVVGSGRVRLAATVTQALIDVLDCNARFTDNSIVVDMRDAEAAGTMVRLAGLFGFYGGNQLTTKPTSALVPTISYARMTVDKADVLKGGFVSSGP